MMRRLITILFTVLLPVAAAAQGPGLFVVDVGTKTIYEVNLNGKLRSQPFLAPSSVSSAIAHDPFTGTLWGAAEGSSVDPNLPGRFVNFSTTGEVLSSFGADVFGSNRPEGIAVDFFDANSLWTVDDPDSILLQPMIYNVDRSGALLGSFPTPPGATSPQSIAVDPFDGSLWLTDNAADAIYNLDRNGTVIRSFTKFAYNPLANNPQGISVDETNGTLWITDKQTGTVYNLTVEGSLLSSFVTASFDSNSTRPTAITFYPGFGGQGLYAEIGALADELFALHAGEEFFKKAIEKLNKARKDSHWDGPDSLLSDRPYRELKEAVKQLRQVTGFGIADAQMAIEKILEISRGLAQHAIDEAIAAGGTQEYIDKALAHLDKALTEVAKGETDKAVGEYKNAWKDAQEAF